MTSAAFAPPSHRAARATSLPRTFATVDSRPVALFGPGDILLENATKRRFLLVAREWGGDNKFITRKEWIYTLQPEHSESLILGEAVVCSNYRPERQEG